MFRILFSPQSEETTPVTAWNRRRIAVHGTISRCVLPPGECEYNLRKDLTIETIESMAEMVGRVTLSDVDATD